MVPQRKKQQLSSSRKDRKKIQDRKKNLFKKAEELSILCGVDVCLILDQCQSTVAETWPQDPEEVKRIITAYKATVPVISDASSSSSEPKGLKETKAYKATVPVIRDASSSSSEPKGLKETKAYKATVPVIRDASSSSSEPKGLKETKVYKATVPVIRDASIPSSEPKGLEESKAGKSHGGCQNVVDYDEEREKLYPTWDERLDYYSEEELTRLLASLDAKLQHSRKRIDNEQ